MEDIFNAELLCNECHGKTKKSYVIKDGFKIRTWHCNKCNKKWHHPSDIEEYKCYMNLKNKDFQVKLRPVGNSWTVSIPREIINFQEVTQTKIVRLSMHEPGKVMLHFTKIKKVY